jgi:hypothetical protein
MLLGLAITTSGHFVTYVTHIIDRDTAVTLACSTVASRLDY